MRQIDLQWRKLVLRAWWSGVLGELPTQYETITDNSFPEPIDSEEETEMEENTSPYERNI